MLDHPAIENEAALSIKRSKYEVANNNVYSMLQFV